MDDKKAIIKIKRRQGGVHHRHHEGSKAEHDTQKTKTKRKINEKEKSPRGLPPEEWHLYAEQHPIPVAERRQHDSGGSGDWMVQMQQKP